MFLTVVWKKGLKGRGKKDVGEQGWRVRLRLQSEESDPLIKMSVLCTWTVSLMDVLETGVG